MKTASNIIELLCPRQRWAGQSIFVFVTSFQSTTEFLRTECHFLGAADGVTVEYWNVGCRPLVFGALEDSVQPALTEAKRQAQAYVDAWTKQHTQGFAKEKGEVLDCTLEPAQDSPLRILTQSPAWAEALMSIINQSENPALQDRLNRLFRPATSTAL
ncbi:MAG: hypothetical protein K9N47_25265 [Prosthecobacter sp.]|uniref:hypothetical protein n=1 Tax=Prosthecobacter sp. TaxID=1965333 RepID=UPI00262873D6|nr:hypothetical protein [Prosthecobacter sp.]MCF7789457.1 hypothetical protein [Prosthecobacter sp.]